MKTMKYILIAVLIFVTVQGTQGEAEYQGVAMPKFKVNAAHRPNQVRESSSEEDHHQESLAEVELLRMVSPKGNEVVFSLSSKVMGRSLDSEDYTISGVEPKLTHSGFCQMAISEAQELRRAEMKLELELLVEELKTQKKPRFLTETQREILSKVPTCEVFKLQLTAIVKLMEGYDYSELALTTVR